ncbi:single-stranded DNA-binding protein [Glutamicibacter sp.]|uniref:single-stranded DNA-binding protein n=1 Tax=Glutamicibacter sp. TaxID=1931995 RepID=UPI003D6ABC0C
MSNEQYITIRGRLTATPELRFTPSGSAVANFTIASNARKFDKQSNEWKDAETIFWRCSAWRELGENIAESLDKGMAVIALAELESRSYDTKSGERRTVTEAKIESIGPDLRWATAKVGAGARGNGEGAAGRAPNSSSGAGWNNSTGGGGWGNPPANEPPF